MLVDAGYFKIMVQGSGFKVQGIKTLYLIPFTFYQ
jgi:hypothetical protein